MANCLGVEDRFDRPGAAGCRTVCQVRGKCNRLPGANERTIVERWAAVEGLRMLPPI
jgi:hypothetical protein